MREIVTKSGDIYKFDDDGTGMIYKNNILLPKAKAEAVYTGKTPPEFAGIYLKDSNQIVSLAGNINPVDDVKSI